MSRWISMFPFVRAVFLSGSISKNYMDETTDIDYFIITEPGRLWLARTMLILFKKIFLLNSFKYFCINYLIDSDHLEIEEKNLFTATELVTLVPIYGEQHYHHFRDANTWADRFYPNFPIRDTGNVLKTRLGLVKRAMESPLSGSFGEWLDKFCMNRTVRYWDRKFEGFNPIDFKVAFKSRSYVSKHHPGSFQQKVLQAHAQGVRDFEARHNLSLSDLNGSTTVLDQEVVVSGIG